MDRAHTRQLDSISGSRSFDDFLRSHRAALVVLSGPTAGSEYAIDREKFTIGRGPGVDLVFQDDAMSREHAVIEFADEGFRVRDLCSTNGILHNGESLQAASLAHGDRLQLGEHGFQYICEEVPVAPEVYVVEDD